MLRVKNPTIAPPGNWSAQVAATGATWSGEDFAPLMEKVRLHLEANGLVGDPDRIIHETTAKRLSAEGHGDGVEQVYAQPRKRTVADLWAGTKLYTLLASKEAAGIDGLESEGEANRRAAICAGCPYNTGPLHNQAWLAGWAGGLMRQRVGDLRTTEDAQIGQCSICTCELRTAVWITAEDLRATSGTEFLSQLPAHCWKRPILTK
jgi:hypothetical protein